jgi:hypothetical protein
LGPQAVDAQVIGAQFTAPAKALARVQLEALGFVNRRAQAYLEIPSRLSRCRTPQDLINEQMGFWQTAIEQYSESSRRMAEAWSQVIASGGGFSGTSGPRERDYITFSTAKEAGSQSGAQSSRDRHRRVA